MKTFLEGWRNFWYDSFEAQDLFNFRIIFYVFLVVYSLFFDRGNLSWLTLPSGFWQPVSVLRLLHEPMTYETGVFVQIVFDVSCVLCALGFCFRFFSIACFVSFYTIVAMTNSYGVALHDDLGIVIFLLVFACSNAHQGLSLDSLLFGKDVSKGRSITWTLRLCQVVFGMVFFMAGFSKIYSSGLSWIVGDTLKNYMIYAHYREALAPFAEKLGIGLWISKFPIFCRVLAFIVLFLEFLGPFIGLFKKRFTVALIALYGLMVMGFYFTVTDGFLNLFILFSCWWPLIRQLNESQNRDREGNTF